MYFEGKSKRFQCQTKSKHSYTCHQRLYDFMHTTHELTRTHTQLTKRKHNFDFDMASRSEDERNKLVNSNEENLELCTKIVYKLIGLQVQLSVCCANRLCSRAQSVYVCNRIIRYY